MSREYPDWFDPWKAAEGRRTFAGSMRLDRMERLRPCLAESSGEAHFVAAIEFDGQGRVTILIEVEAGLPLICQCSLEPYIEAVRRKSLLGVIEDMAEEALMPENYEPVMTQHGRLAMLDLVEDELLLGLPQVPKNPDFDAKRLAVTGLDEPQDTTSEASVQQPFAGLAERLKDIRSM
jgi:uncharacterized protein